MMRCETFTRLECLAGSNKHKYTSIGIRAMLVEDVYFFNLLPL